MATSSFLLGMCQQRSRQQLLNQPNGRLELQLSPYGSYSQNQLDMRRKVEILKYNSNKTGTRNATKSELWGQIVAGKYQRRTYSQMDLRKELGLLNCSFKENVPTPTSACGVPGPIMYLTNDPTVPLYNYATNTDSYSSLPPTPVTDPWLLYTSYNSYLNPGVDRIVTTLFVQRADSPTATLQLSIPLAIYADISPVKDVSGVIVLNINRITLGFYFNDSVGVDLTNRIQQTFSNSIATNISNINLSDPEFQATFFIGMVTVPQLSLPISRGNVYDLRINVDYTLRCTSLHGMLLTANSGLICNVTAPNTSLISNGNLDYMPGVSFSPFRLASI